MKPVISSVPFYRAHGKRWLECALALLGLVALAPVLGLVAVLVRVNLGSPVIFRQLRPGKNGVGFTLLKFRTMTDARDADRTLLPDADRLPRFGRFLRSTSLDELPELWNVLRGDMGVVGPRPLLVQYLDRYTSEQARRHEIRPGITGWAQVNGRNAISWEERFALDVWYVENLSFSLDLRILLRTLAKVLTRDGITEGGAATMSEFAVPTPAGPQ